MKLSDRSLDARIKLISDAIGHAKAKTIKRINRQLARMSPNDLRGLERLIGKR